MAQKLLVTGASGFIASHCILELLNHGYLLKGTLRNLDRARAIRDILGKHTKKADRIEFVQADLTDAQCWDEAVKGCDGVLHIASPVPVIQPKEADEIVSIARDGTLNVLNAALRANIQRVVVTSSTAAVRERARNGAGVYSAEDWTDPDEPGLSPYSLSKTIAEKAAWEFVHNNEGIELSVINPAFVFGPALETDYGSSLEILCKLLKGKLPLIPNLGFTIVDVRDVAALHRLAFESDNAAGKRFLCSSGFRWYKEIAIFLRERFPGYRKKVPSKMMPNFILKIVSIFDPSVARFIPNLGIRKDMDNSPAMEILGWQPRAPEEAIESGARSLIELGIV
jgi:nucleoside-diphosphate-sugar epimerase